MLKKRASQWRTLPHKPMCRSAQPLYQHLFEDSPQAILLVDESGQIFAANPMAETLFEFAPHTLVGQPVEPLIPEVLRANHTVLHQTYLQIPTADEARPPEARLQPLNLELAAHTRTGRVFPADLTLNPFFYQNQWLVQCLVRDGTPRKAREKTVNEQSELVRLLQDIAIASNEANTVEDAFGFAIDRIVQYLNWPVGHALLVRDDPLLSPTNIWNKNLSDRFAAFQHVSEALHFRPGVGLPGMVLNSAQPVWVTNLPDHPQFLRSDEARKVGLRTGLAMPIFTGREVAGVLEFFQTELIPPNPNLMAVLPHLGVQIGRVVERKRSEDALRKSAAQMRMVMTNLPVSLWVIDRQGKLTMMEGRGVNALNIKPNEVLGRSALDLAAQRPELVDLLRRALAGETIHTELAGEKGNVFETYFTPYYDSNWAVDGVIGLSFDISERKQMQSELDEMRHRLLESIETERARLGQQLHDGPLQDLYGAFYQIQAALEKLGGNELETTNRALTTLQQVATTLRLICGDLHPSTLVHLGLQKSIRSHAERLQERMDNLAIHLDLTRDEIISPVSADTQPDSAQPDSTQPGVSFLPGTLRLALFRIYQQLIDNATRHAQAQHIWVRLWLPPGQAILEVQDDGRGFDLPKNWITLVRQGRLGLVSSLERVEGLNGKMEIETLPDQGTLVRVILPRE